MPSSPSKRPPTPTEDLTQEQKTALYAKIGQNIAMYKKDSQLNYKQMLDE